MRDDVAEFDVLRQAPVSLVSDSVSNTSSLDRAGSRFSTHDGRKPLKASCLSGRDSGSGWFVLKTRWTSALDSDWGMEVLPFQGARLFVSRVPRALALG